MVEVEDDVGLVNCSLVNLIPGGNPVSALEYSNGN